MIRFSRLLAMAAMTFVLACLFSACGSSSDSTTPTGSVDADVTDAPALDYAHVYVTVTKLAFHLDAGAGSNSAGWQTVTLQAPVTVDLAQLTSGKVYGDVAGGKSLFNGVVLPVGKYNQIRIFLASTENVKTTSAQTLGLSYNNEVQLNNDATHYALRIPSPGEGIRLIPESPVVVTAGGSARLALDFNLNNDVVKVSPNGQTEYILKPRLGYFDMNQVGAVTGAVSISTPSVFSNLSTSRFVIKAEQINKAGTFRIVRRLTSVDKTTGAFTLKPLPVFGNATTANYDILLRGRNIQTAIVKGVKVHKAGSVNLGTITMTPGSEFTAQLPTPFHPTGAWLNFYQTIAGDQVPFEVRYRHLNPYTGKFSAPIELSTGPIQVATFNNATQALGAFNADSTSQGSFSAIIEASFYGRGTPVTVANGQSPVTFTPSALIPLPSANAISGTITIPSTLTGLAKGHLFITHGGLVIDSYDLSTVAPGTVQIPAGLTFPGGTAAAPLPGAYYGINVLAWGLNIRASGSQQHIDLTTGIGTAAITMQ